MPCEFRPLSSSLRLRLALAFAGATVVFVVDWFRQTVRRRASAAVVRALVISLLPPQVRHVQAMYETALPQQRHFHALYETPPFALALLRDGMSPVLLCHKVRHARCVP